MSLRLSSYVTAGEIDNRQRNTTRGWIALRGTKRRIDFELAGNPCPDLLGKRLYFEAPAVPRGGLEALDASDLDVELRQFGGVGEITAHRLVRVFDCPRDEFLRRCELGEPPPTFWTRMLHLEWYGNNGRVLVTLPDADMCFIEEVDGQEREIELGPPEDPPFDPDAPPVPEPSKAVGLSADEDLRDDSDPFELFDPELESLLEESLGPDHPGLEAPEGSEERAWAEMEVADEVMERGGGMPLGELVTDAPAWDTLSDEEAAGHLSALVGHLALYRVSYQICPHLSLREAYRLLVEVIAPNERIHPELRATGWVTHLDTADFCPQCQAENQEEEQDPPAPSGS